VGPTFEIVPLADGSGFRLIGELDLLSVKHVDAVLEKNALRTELVLELSELTFIDSAGLRMLFTHAGSRNGNGPLVLLDPSSSIARVFEITSLDQHRKIEIRRTEAAA
jgi:anti-anti-sigma factor